MGLPQLPAGLDIEKRQAEENYREQQHHHILHRNSRISVSMAPVSTQDERACRVAIRFGSIAPSRAACS
jgi:hypothetical protein